MGELIQRRQFLSRLSTKSSKPLHTDASNSQTAERSFEEATAPRGSLRAAGVQSGINAYSGTWTEKEMLHLLRRTTFGAPKSSVDQIKGMSVSAAVDFLIDNPVLPPAPLNNYTAVADTGGVPFGSSWIDVVMPDPTDATIKSTLMNSRLSSSFKPWWMGLMLTQKTHILEKITLFWANHFGTDTANNNRPKAIYQHYNLLRTYGLASFRDLIKQVTIDPHMLYFLSGYTNSKTAPNENYGRELQELFTIGKGPDSHYSETDVQLAAKVLTGWQVQPNTNGTYTSYFTLSRHDTTTKTFSNFYDPKPITSNGINEVDDLLTKILLNSECAKFLVRRLYTWFVYYDITPDIETNVITPLADILRNSNYNISVVLKALFKSEHFFDPLNMGGIIKSPVDLYVGMAREFKMTLAAAPIDVQYAHWKNFSDRCANTSEAQNIGDPPNVAGWPAYYNAPSKFYEAWMTGASIQIKAKNIKSFCSKNGITVNTTGITTTSLKLQIDPIAFNKQFSNPGDPNAVIANFILYLLPFDLTQAQKDTMKKILLNNQATDSYWTSAWNDYVANPTNTTFLGLVQTRLYDVLTYVTALPEYFLS